MRSAARRQSRATARFNSRAKGVSDYGWGGAIGACDDGGGIGARDDDDAGAGIGFLAGSAGSCGEDAGIFLRISSCSLAISRKT